MNVDGVSGCSDNTAAVSVMSMVACSYVCTYVRMYVCMYVSMYVCIYIYTHTIVWEKLISNVV